MTRLLFLFATSLLASCGNAQQAAPVPSAIAMPDDLGLVAILDQSVHDMASEVNATGGHADVETYQIVRNSKCHELATSDESPRQIECEFEATTEFSPILGDAAHIRSATMDNSREWMRVRSTFQQDGENWKVQTPPTKLKT